MQAKETAPDRSAWQFSLRSMMIGVTLFALVLGSGMWLDVAGALGCIFLIALGTLAYAIYSRRKRLSCVTGVFLPFFIAGIGLMYFFGPYTSTTYLCTVCGQQETQLTFYNLTIYQNQFETEISASYRQAKPAPHEHRWTVIQSYEQHWGGIRRYQSCDWLGLGLRQTELILKASERKVAFVQ
jgi:hypothetical protein